MDSGYAAKLDIRDRAGLVLVPAKPLPKSRMTRFVIVGSEENVDDFAGVLKCLVKSSEQMSVHKLLVLGHGRSLRAFQFTAARRGRARDTRQLACGRLAAL